MYIFTRLSTNERRGGAPVYRSRDSSSEFSTALAGGRGAASASTASRSQAPRGGSSAPPVWSRPSSACPTQARAAQRRLLGTAVASRRVSWFGRESVACEGGMSHLSEKFESPPRRGAYARSSERSPSAGGASAAAVALGRLRPSSCWCAFPGRRFMPRLAGRLF